MAHWVDVSAGALDTLRTGSCAAGCGTGAGGAAGACADRARFASAGRTGLPSSESSSSEAGSKTTGRSGNAGAVAVGDMGGGDKVGAR